MTIDRLSSTAGWLSVLRTGNPRKTGQSTGAGGVQSSPARKQGAADLRRDLQAIAKVTVLDDPAAVADARLRMIRVILQWELGPEAREHPEWHAMVDAIAATLQANDASQAQFEAVLRQLGD